MVDSEEGHLTRFVEQVGEGDEGFGLLQVEDQHGSDEGHALDLKHHKHRPRSAREKSCVWTDMCFIARMISLT